MMALVYCGVNIGGRAYHVKVFLVATLTFFSDPSEVFVRRTVVWLAPPTDAKQKPLAQYCPAPTFRTPAGNVGLHYTLGTLDTG